MDGPSLTCLPHSMSPAPRSPRDDQRSPLPAAWLDLVIDAAHSEEGARAALGRDPSDQERAALHAARGHLLALSALTRQNAPDSLEGVVVASLEAGHRQDRAARMTASLEPLAAPASLDRRVEAQLKRSAPGLAAPSVLDRLVDERIGDPEAGMVRSMAGRLGRRTAPNALDERMLEQGAGARVEPVRGVSALHVFGGVFVAAALVFVARLSTGAGTGGVVVDGPSGPTLTIVRIESLDDVEASAVEREFLRSITGEFFGGRS